MELTCEKIKIYADYFLDVALVTAIGRQKYSVACYGISLILHSIAA